MKRLTRIINRTVGQDMAACHQAVANLARELNHPATGWAFYPQGDDSIVRVMDLTEDALSSWEFYKENNELELALVAIIYAFFGR